MAGKSYKDNYPVAAVRHFVDGRLLYERNRWNNSMCHYAFSAECALKTLYEQISGKKGFAFGHDIDKEWTDIWQYFAAIRILDAQAGTLLWQLDMPKKLFDGHPSRRYEDDIEYSAEEMRAANDFTEQLIQKVISMVLDGVIN